MPTTGTMRYLTIGDSTYEVYNTDTEVIQTYVSASGYTNWRPLVVGYSSNSSETTAPTTITGTTYTFNTIKVQPSSGTIRFGAAALYNGDYTTTISADTLTASRTLTAPNKSGTIALISDIPDVSGYAPLASPTFTGVPTAPTPGQSAGDTEIATVKYVQDAVSGAGTGTVTNVAVANATNGGLSVSGSPITSSGTITLGHSNVLSSAQTTQAVYPIKIDKNGHISEYGSAVTIPTKVSQLTNDSGYITSYTETDPIFSASAAAGITSTDISNWNAKVSDDKTWNGVELDKVGTTYGQSSFIPGRTSTSATTAYQIEATTIPNSYRIVKWDNDKYLYATTPSANDNSTKVATTAYVDSAITALPEPMIFKGSLGTGGTITSLPTASSLNEGFTYKVITAGTYASQTAKVGDTFISDGNNWILIPSGDEPGGTVTSVGVSNATDGGLSISGSPITSSGTISIGHSNVLASAQTTSGIYPIKIDKNGHISEYGSAVTIPTITLNGSATTSPSFYAPIGTGNNGQVITWNDTAGGAIWSDSSDVIVHITREEDYNNGSFSYTSDMTYYEILEALTSGKSVVAELGYLYYDYEEEVLVEGPNKNKYYVVSYNALDDSMPIIFTHIYGAYSDDEIEAGMIYFSNEEYAGTNNIQIQNATIYKTKWEKSTTSTTWRPTFSSSYSGDTQLNTLNGIDVYQYYNTAGGYRRLNLGNATAYKTSGGAYGAIRLYGTGATYYGDLNPGAIGDNSLTANRTWTLPDKTGTIALTSDVPTISLNGSSTTSASFYAPTTAGTSGQVLTSNGSGAPTWAAITVPTKTSDLTNDSGFITGMTILSYGTSTWQDFITAYNANKVVYCRASSNSNPATGSQTRLAFMTYVNNATTPTEVEFQYYRSIATHSASQQGDQVFVYKLTNSSGGTWTVTTREAASKMVAGSGLSSSYSNGTLTLSASETDPVFLASAAHGISSSDISSWNGKQASLVSGTNIKTVTGTSILGSGDLLPSAVGYTTTVPAAANTTGLKFVLCDSEPATKYDGWVYLIKES